MCHHSVLSRKDEKKCSLKRYWQIPLHKAPCHLTFKKSKYMDSPQVNRCSIFMKSHIHLHFQFPAVISLIIAPVMAFFPLYCLNLTSL